MFDHVCADLRLTLRGKSGGVVRSTAIVLFNRGFKAVLLYRAARWLRVRGIPIMPALLHRIAQHWYAVDIDPAAKIGPGLVLVHCFGIVVGNDVQIDGDCCIYHGVTLGNRGSEWVGSRRADGHPRVGRSCMFGAGAKVLGPIAIGDNCVIGANSVVVSDVPPDSVVAGSPARIIARRPRMNEQLRPVEGYRDEMPSVEAQ